MRSRLPGKLRSSLEMHRIVFVENRARFTKRRLIIGGFITQILQQTDQAPRQHQTNAHKQQQIEHDSHTSPPADFPKRDYKSWGFSEL
jgi:hypothetical protein